MNPNASFPTPRDRDLEAQTVSGGRGSRAASFRTAGLSKPASHTSFTHPGKGPSSCSPDGARAESSEVNETGVPNNTTQPAPEWKPWKLDDPYLSEMPRDEQAMEKWVKVMKESDDGMCQGWREQIDTLIIFAGLFSATVTAFTIESYQWLAESPADTLARLQLRALLNETHDPATVDRLAPPTFVVSPPSVLINALWFSSLTLALAAVVTSILCRQWLYEYQRYENFTLEEMFLIRGLRYRGLQAWRVPTIIAFLPILLQAALMLFLVGLLILLGPLETIVASINTAIVGLTFMFLVITTILPAIQYTFPKFDTQCAYKSSQSWSFLRVFTFRLFDFSMFTNWATFDRWEVTRVYNGTGHTLSRVYELLSSSIGAFQGIYNFLADTSIRPLINADLTLLPDFITGLDASRKHNIIKAIPQIMDSKEGPNFHRLEQLKGYVNQNHTGQLKPTAEVLDPSFQSSFDEHNTTSHAHFLRTQMTLSQFLRRDVHVSDPAVFNRYVEHWARCINDTSDHMKEAQWKTGDKRWSEIFWPTNLAHHAHMRLNPEIASKLVKLYSYLLKTNQFSSRAMYCFSAMYPSFVESHQQQGIVPPPFNLLKDIQDWISRMAESDLARGVKHADEVLFCLVDQQNIFNLSRTSDLEEQSLRSFAQSFVNFYERKDVLKKGWNTQSNSALAVLRNYLDQNPHISSQID